MRAIVLTVLTVSCGVEGDLIEDSESITVGSHSLSYVGKQSNITDFTGYGQHLYYFPLFGLTSPATAERTDDRDVYHQGIFRQFEHHRLLSLDTRTFSPDAGGDPLGVKTRGGYSSWPVFTLPDGATGRSGTFYDDATLDRNSNNSINQIITLNDQPKDFCLNLITDNTAGENNPDERLEARLDSGGTQIDVNLAGHPDFAFDGLPDMYTFLYEGMNDDERIKIRLSTSNTSDHRGAGLGGVMVSDVSTCRAQPPGPGAGVVMDNWRGFATGPYDHPRMSGSNRMLIFTAHGRDNANRSVQSVSYGGRAMTKLVDRTFCDGKCVHSSIWYLMESGIAAAAGTRFSVNWNSNPGDRGYDSVFFAGVNQSSPFDDSDSAATAGNPVRCHSNVVEAGHVQIYSASHKNQGDYAPLGGFIEAGDYPMGSNGKASVGYIDGAGTSVSPGASLSSNTQTIVCAEIQD